MSTSLNKLANKPELYEFRIIRDNDLQVVHDFLQENYFKDEPLAVSFELTDDDLETAIYETQFLVDIDDGVSIMAITKTGKIIGIILNKLLDKVDYLVTDNQYSDSRFGKITKFEDYVFNEASKIILNRFPNVKKTLYISIVAVDRSWRNHNLALRLIDHTIRSARENGFDLVRGECSSAFTTLICRHLGCECIYKLDYEDYKENGTCVISPKEPHTSITAFIYNIRIYNSKL